VVADVAHHVTQRGNGRQFILDSDAERLVSPTGLGSQVNFKISLAHPNAIGYVPSLQREDGSYIGTDSLGNVDALGQDGSMAWQEYLPGATPLYATADGGAIVTTTTQCPTAPVGSPTCTPTLGTLYTFDQYGNFTPQGADTGAEYSWTGQWYDPPPAGGSISAVSQPQPSLSPSFAAILEGNHSGTPVGIQQVQTNQTVADVEQAPSSDAVTNPAYHANYNSIELLTPVSPGQIFQNYIQTFSGVNVQINTQADEATVTSSLPVTAAGQIITFDLLAPIAVATANVCAPAMSDGLCTPPYPFSVVVKGFSPSAQIISVVTLQGHPLRGRRYWRVFSVGTNDIVVETGAVDTPGPGPQNYIGYYLTKSDQIKVWQEDLQYILRDLSNQGLAVKGSNSTFNLVNGEWNDARKPYIWNYLCFSSAWCN
jgi:hypothetical protein